MNTIVDVIMPGDRESGSITQNGQSLPEDFTYKMNNIGQINIEII